MTQGGILSQEGGGGGLTESQVFTGDGVGAVGLLDGMFQFFGLPNTPLPEDHYLISCQVFTQSYLKFQSSSEKLSLRCLNLGSRSESSHSIMRVHFYPLMRVQIFAPPPPSLSSGQCLVSTHISHHSSYDARC